MIAATTCPLLPAIIFIELTTLSRAIIITGIIGDINPLAAKIINIGFTKILSAIASKNLEQKVRVILDIEGYKAKREKTLEDLAEKLEKTVIKTKKSVTLEPMQAYERKIIHTKLQNSEKVETRSIGEEPRRRVVISLKRK